MFFAVYNDVDADQPSLQALKKLEHVVGQSLDATGEVWNNGVGGAAAVPSTTTSSPHTAPPLQAGIRLYAAAPLITKFSSPAVAKPVPQRVVESSSSDDTDEERARFASACVDNSFFNPAKANGGGGGGGGSSTAGSAGAGRAEVDSSINNKNEKGKKKKEKEKKKKKKRRKLTAEAASSPGGSDSDSD